MSTPKPKTRRTPEALAQFHAEKAKLHARRAAEAKVRDNPRWSTITAAVRALKEIPDAAFSEATVFQGKTIGEAEGFLPAVIETLETEADRIAGIEEA